MNTFKIILSICLIAFYSCSGNKNLTIDTATTLSECQKENGYWYKGKCWADYSAEEELASAAEIDDLVKKEMLIIENSEVKINGKAYPIMLFFPEMGEKEIVFVTMFAVKNGTQTLILPAKEKQLKKGKFVANAMLLDGNLMTLSEDEDAVQKIVDNPLATGELQTTVNNLDDLDFVFSGLLQNENSKKTYQIDFQTNEAIMGAGTSTVEVKNNEIHINGELGTRTYHQLKTAIAEHPNAKMVVLGQINGSLNDEVNMHTGRILREAGLSTKVLKDSEIASGGVDLFCAGKERIVEKGAKIGIHSWCCLNDLTAAEIPKDHPAHQYQIAYFTMCLGEEIGPDFYFHTLAAAPFDGVHWMTDVEIQEWTVSTKFVVKSSGEF